jgi:hypothetical protein
MDSKGNMVPSEWVSFCQRRVSDVEDALIELAEDMA